MPYFLIAISALLVTGYSYHTYETAKVCKTLELQISKSEIEGDLFDKYVTHQQARMTQINSLRLEQIASGCANVPVYLWK